MLPLLSSYFLVQSWTIAKKGLPTDYGLDPSNECEFSLNMKYDITAYTTGRIALCAVCKYIYQSFKFSELSLSRNYPCPLI